MNEETVDEKYKKIKKAYFKAAEHEGEDYKYLSLRNEDVEFMFDLIELQRKKTENQCRVHDDVLSPMLCIDIERVISKAEKKF